MGISFKIPFLPLSMNSLYGITVRGARIKVFLKPEGRRFKENAKLFMPPLNVPRGKLMRFEAELHGHWFHKNGKVRKIDLPNLEKVLIDAVAEKYLDGRDELIWEKLTSKIHEDKDDFVICDLKLIEAEGG